MNQLGPLAAEENLARYLVEKSKFSCVNQRVKYSAFMPPRDLRVSVFRIIGLAEGEIWDIGERTYAAEQNRPLLGRAEVQVCHVEDIGLVVIPDDKPHRHANIEGWPQGQSEQKLRALQLAEKATLHLKMQT